MRATNALEPIDARRFRLVLREPFGFVLDALAKPGAMVPMIMPRRLAETPPSRPITEPDTDFDAKCRIGGWSCCEILRTEADNVTTRH